MNFLNMSSRLTQYNFAIIALLSLAGCNVDPQLTPGSQALGVNEPAQHIHPTENEGGVLDGSGGEVIRSTETEVRQVLETLKPRLSGAAYRMKGMMGTFDGVHYDAYIDELSEVLNAFFTNDNSLGLDIFDYLESDLYKIRIYTDKACHDEEGPVDAAATAGGSLCFSIPRLQKIPPSELSRSVVFLAMHEIAHVYGFDEESSQLLQESLTNFYSTSLLSSRDKKQIADAAGNIRHAFYLTGYWVDAYIDRTPYTRPDFEALAKERIQDHEKAIERFEEMARQYPEEAELMDALIEDLRQLILTIKRTEEERKNSPEPMNPDQYDHMQQMNYVSFIFNSTGRWFEAAEQAQQSLFDFNVEVKDAKRSAGGFENPTQALVTESAMISGQVSMAINEFLRTFEPLDISHLPERLEGSEAILFQYELDILSWLAGRRIAEDEYFDLRKVADSSVYRDSEKNILVDETLPLLNLR